jgi:carbon storage regulator
MLSINRKKGESVVINNDIVLTVLEVSGKTVRLGFEYPKTATVLRQELYDKIQLENQLASQEAINVGKVLQDFKKASK